METNNRTKAVAAAAEQQAVEQDRMIAVLEPKALARVPVPVAEKPEPSPYEKFSGCPICGEVTP